MNVKVNAIIVTYYPDLEKLNKLIDSLKQIDKIILFKNSHFVLPVNYSNVTEIDSKVNIGTAAAYNCCINHLNEDCNYVFILDQDTVLERTCLDNLIKDSQNISKLYRHFLISPLEVDLEGNSYGWGSINFLNLEIQEVRCSGMFINREIFNYIRFDEKLFVDYVDWDFCWRAKNKYNLYIFRSKNAKIYHELGSYFPGYFGFNFKTMSPNRIYSQIINAKKLFCKWEGPYLKKILLILRPIKLILSSWLYKDFFLRYKFIFLGIVHSEINKKYFK